MSVPAHPRCGVWMRPRKNDYRALETDESGAPHQFWHGDLWECPKCGEQILAGFGLPIPRHAEGFERIAAEPDTTISGRLLALKERE